MSFDNRKPLKTQQPQSKIERSDMKIRRKDAFFAKVEALGMGLTYGDVQLKTGYSATPPSKVNIESLISRNVPLKRPIVSAAMEFSEDTLAIGLAMDGGMGVINRKMNPTRQARMVARVKREIGAKIENPICFRESETMETIFQRIQTEKITVNCFPVINDNGVYVGLLTKTSFKRGRRATSMKAGKFMEKQYVGAPADTDAQTAYQIMGDPVRDKLPLVDSEGRVVAMYTINDLDRVLFGNKADSYNLDARGHLRVAAAIGSMRDEPLEKRAEPVIRAGADALFLESAHAHSIDMIETLKELKRAFPNVDIIVGNISEGESARSLVDAGADGIRVGQGPGSICTTRVVTGAGCPQLTAVHECEKAIRGSGVPINADGGIEYPGHIAFAIGAGAHSVTLGGLLAGTDEAAGKIVWIKGNEHKRYRGMGSLGAMMGEDGKASRDRYRQDDTPKAQFVPEGVEGAVPCSGPLAGVIAQLEEGLRRGMGYVGAANIAEMHEKADFRWHSSAGTRESHPRILMTTEAPNYKPREREI